MGAAAINGHGVRADRRRVEGVIGCAMVSEALRAAGHLQLRGRPLSPLRD